MVLCFDYFHRSNKNKCPSAGLDPAYPLFQDVGPEDRLDSSDAYVVEVVHTSGRYLAFHDPLGHVDFYPNGGDWPQPGCLYDILSKS